MGEGQDAPRPGGLDRVIRGFEWTIVVGLAILMMIVVGLSAIDLARRIVTDLVRPPLGLIPVDELLELFGFFLLILIGLELLETLKAYLHETVVHIDVVLEVALIAVARKVIVLDLAKHDGVTVLAIGVLIIALAGAFLLLPLRRRRTDST